MRYGIYRIESDGTMNTFDIVEADSVSATPAGFALCVKGKIIDEIVYAIPTNCGLRKLNNA